MPDLAYLLLQERRRYMNDTSITIAHSVFSHIESGLDTNPSFWSTHAPQSDPSTEVRSRWTFDNLYPILISKRKLTSSGTGTSWRGVFLGRRQ